MTSLYTVIDGEQYDLAQFMAAHPGGKDFLMLAVNRDATILFHSYHRKLDIAKRMLKSLPKVSSTITSTCHQISTPFHQRIRQAVNAHFEVQKLSSRGGLWMLIKSMLLIMLTALVYYLVVFAGIYGIAPLFGVLLAVNGLAIQHDANHGSFSTSPLLNRLFGFVDDIIGGSALVPPFRICFKKIS
jgi:acyl-lipid (7-3)-desaturase (Delta-4 desaturase)